MAGIRTCDRESQVLRPNHYTTEPPKEDFITNENYLFAMPNVVWMNIFQHIVMIKYRPVT